MAASDEAFDGGSRRASEPLLGRTVHQASRHTRIASPANHHHVPDMIYTFFHGNCRKCHHWHDAVPAEISPNPMTHTSFRCEKCKNKIFGIGRRSTHNSLLSRETTFSWSPIGGPSHAAVACVTDGSSISPGHSIPSRRPSALHSLISHNTVLPASSNRISEKSSLHDQDVEQIATRSTGKPSTVLQLGKSKESTPTFGRFDVTGGPERPSKRLKYLAKGVRSFSKIFLRVNVEVIGSRCGTKPVASGSPGAEASIQQASVEEDRAEPIVEEERRDRRNAVQEDIQNDQEPLSESPTMRNSRRFDSSPDAQPAEDDNVARQKKDPARLERILSIRRKATRDAGTMTTTCRCTPECHCKVPPPPPSPSQSSRLTSASWASIAPPPSLDYSLRTDSASTTDSARSQPASVTLRRVGAHLLDSYRRRGGRGGIGRPSRLSSMVTSDSSNSSDVHDNSGPGAMPAVPAAVSAEDVRHVRRSSTDAMTSTSMHPMMLTDIGRVLTAEPGTVSEHEAEQARRQLNARLAASIVPEGDSPRAAEDPSPVSFRAPGEAQDTGGDATPMRTMPPNQREHARQHPNLRVSTGGDVSRRSARRDGDALGVPVEESGTNRSEDATPTQETVDARASSDLTRGLEGGLGEPGHSGA